MLTQQFRDSDIESPELDARLLVGHALGLDHTALVLQAERALTAAEAYEVATLAARRLAREPLARILRMREFWGLPLRLNTATLVPRPETETVVEAALEALDRSPLRERALRIADLGTGSGALLLALLSELPAASGIATDVSFAALDCARGNAVALGLDARATFVACNYCSALRGPFDLIISNPPYIARAEIAGLQPEVRDFDPPRALDGGEDGLDGYRAILEDAHRVLSPDGIIVLEIGAGQCDAVAALVADTGFALEGPARSDLSGVARALTVKPLP